MQKFFAGWLDGQIGAVMDEVRHLIAADPALSKNLELVRSITGFGGVAEGSARSAWNGHGGEVSASILLAELPNIADFTPKALAAFVGLSPRDHSSGTSVRRPGKISRIGTERLRSTLYMCTLSAKRNNKPLADFVARMTVAGKPPKVILIAVPSAVIARAPHAEP